MISFPRTLKAWQSNGFDTEFSHIFKQEIAQFDHQELPLQQGLSLSSYVSNEKISAIINRTEETPDNIIIKSGIFYSGIIAGCSCSDDPTPVDTQNEYCELLINIDKHTAESSIKLITD
ncbi:MAG: hypothetical protein OQK98_12355 [Gammaproteobacteria bacterium]|nr:hypothetical protein [Gammaproteobacteria bacterium]